jgi:hypothetical protein
MPRNNAASVPRKNCQVLAGFGQFWRDFVAAEHGKRARN